MKSLTLFRLALVLAAVSALHGRSAVELPRFTVHSSRVANQAPAGTFAMPVSALRYEPRVDLHARNLVEGQADLTIRGGIFENTAIRLGGLTLTDPQTGHYVAEIPVAPAMLGAPEILVGNDVALGVTNATVGAVSYDWRRIRTGGSAQIGAGPHALWRSEAYQGVATRGRASGVSFGADVAVAHSESDGPIAFGDHRFDRLGFRLQLCTPSSQTDFFAGYQAKFMGWPNLYTPFNSPESDNLQTVLLLLNHRVDLGEGDFLAAGLYHRRNKDDYAFNRFAAPDPANPSRHPFQHTTWQDGGSVQLRRSLGTMAVNARAELLADQLRSTSLTAGRYNSRTLAKISVVPEKSWTDAAGATITGRLGATYDDSNRDDGAFSPIAELAREIGAANLRRVYFSYAEATQQPSYTALNSSATSGLFRGNASLGRATTQNIEVGAVGRLGTWSGHAAVFARRDRSLVDWTFRRGVTARTANAVDVETAGVEAVARRSWGAMDIVVGYTGLTKEPDYRGAAVDASFYALNYARHRFTAAATVRLGRGFEVRMDNVARLQAPNLLRISGGDRTVFSSLALAFRPAASRGLELSAQLDNAWNEDFQEVPSVPAAPRQWSVGASYVW